jgi:hypothetical protein
VIKMADCGGFGQVFPTTKVNWRLIRKLAQDCTLGVDKAATFAVSAPFRRVSDAGLKRESPQPMGQAAAIGILWPGADQTAGQAEAQAAGRSVRWPLAAKDNTARRLAMKASRRRPRSQGIFVVQASAAAMLALIQRWALVILCPRFLSFCSMNPR